MAHFIELVLGLVLAVILMLGIGYSILIGLETILEIYFHYY